MATAPSELVAAAAPTRAGWRESAACLFPPVPAVRLHARTTLVAVAAFAAATAAVLVRQTGAGALDTIYAEDGQIFLEQAYRLGFADAVLEPYAGYAHLVPRLLVAPAAALPIERAAMGLAITAATTTALLAMVAFRALSGHVRAWPLRAVAAAAIVLLPAGQEEVFSVLANVHWFLVPVAALVLLFDPESRLETAIGGAIVFLAAMSDPIAAALVPLAVLRLVALLPARTRLAPVALGLGLAVQALVVLGGSDTRASLEPSRNPVKLVAWWVFDVPGRTLAGSRWVDDIGAPMSWVAALAAGAILVVVTWVSVRHLGATTLLVPAALVVTGALLYAGYAGVAGDRPPRYGVPPGILLVAALAVALDRLRSELAPRTARRLLAVAGAATLVVWSLNLRVDTRRSDGPRWSDEVEAARVRCDGRAGSTAVAIVPQPPWTVEVDCGELG